LAALPSPSTLDLRDEDELLASGVTGSKRIEGCGLTPPGMRPRAYGFVRCVGLDERDEREDEDGVDAGAAASSRTGSKRIEGCGLTPPGMRPRAYGFELRREGDEPADEPADASPLSLPTLLVLSLRPSLPTSPGCSKRRLGCGLLAERGRERGGKEGEWEVCV
jgi:hypothetical protein